MSSLSDIKISLSTLVEVALVTAFVGTIAFISTAKSANAGGSTKDGSGVNGTGKPASNNNKKKKKRAAAAGASAAVAEVKTSNSESDATTNRDVKPEQGSKTAKAAEAKSKGKKGKEGAKQAPKAEAAAARLDSAKAGAPSSSSFAQVASSSTAESSPAPSQAQKTAAEKRYRPEPTTAVSDMRDEAHDPTVRVARVIKVVGGRVGAQPEPESPPTWDDERDEDDDGEWETAKPKKVTKASASSGSTSAFAASTPTPARSIPGLTPAAQTALTKKQRENQKKVEKAAAAKDEAERERLERLAAHRRQLERVRMAEQDRERNKGKGKAAGPRSQNFATSSPAASTKSLSGGMSASLDSNGKLIWD